MTVMPDTETQDTGHEETPPLAFDFNNDTPDSQIWTSQEKTILKSHIEGYRSALRKTKSAYVVAKVIPEIKASWHGRFDRKKLKKDREVNKEWAKKKDVSKRIEF